MTSYLGLLLFIPLVWCQSPSDPICVLETNASCRPEMIEMNLVGDRLRQSEFPPTKYDLDKYDRRCNNVMRCASRLECFTDQSKYTIYKTSCYRIGQRMYDFDYHCISRIFNGIGAGNHTCAINYDFMTENATLNKQGYMSGKNCIWIIAYNVCSYEHADYLNTNYDELMSMYTSKPVKNSGLCNTPYDKFYSMQCEMLGMKTRKELEHLVLNGSQLINKQAFLNSVRELKKCGEKSCFLHEEASIYKNWESAIAEIEKTFEQRPYLLEFECLQNAGFNDFFGKIHKCILDEPIEDCVISTIAENCQQEIVREFKKPILKVPCEQAVEEGSGSN